MFSWTTQASLLEQKPVVVGGIHAVMSFDISLVYIVPIYMQRYYSYEHSG